MTDAPTTIGLIGLGAFGRLAASCLNRHADVLCFDPEAPEDAVRAAGATPVSMEDAAAAPAVVLSVPVQAIPVVCVSIGASLQENALVCDVGSVKLRPVQWMIDTLPRHAQVLGTHPLFGPQTAEELGGIAGEPIVLCRARVHDETYDGAKRFIADTLKLKVLEMSADEHDQQMAFVQGITHLIGRAASAMRLEDFPTATLAYKRLLQMKRNTENDAPELYEAIQHLNPYAAAARRAFLDAVEGVVKSAEANEPARR